MPDWRRFFVRTRRQTGRIARAMWRICRHSAGKKDASRWSYRIYQCFPSGAAVLSHAANVQKLPHAAICLCSSRMERYAWKPVRDVRSVPVMRECLNRTRYAWKPVRSSASNPARSALTSRSITSAPPAASASMLSGMFGSWSDMRRSAQPPGKMRRTPS